MRVRGRLRRLRANVRNVLRYADPRGVGNEILKITDFGAGGRPVLLLPGFMSTRRGMMLLERRLRREGYLVFSLKLGGLFDTFNTHSIEETAQLVKEKVERLYSRYDLGPLAIVGHSKGGLIARYYVKRLGGDAHCCVMVTLGTPHNGTNKAYLGAMLMGAVAPSIWQLTPMSPFIRRLKRGPFPPRVRLASVWSSDDGIASARSATLETDGRADIVNVGLEGLTHRDFLTSKKAYKAVSEQLRLGFEKELERKLAREDGGRQREAG